MFIRLALLSIIQLVFAGSAFAGAVGVPTPVPEPASLALLAAGVGGLAVLRKFRGRK